MVDDDPLIVKIVGEELGDRGFTVDTNTDPTSVLEFLVNTPIDLMLLDLKMPGMDGLTLLKEVEQMSPDLPVIILTGHGDVTSAGEAMRYGAVGYLQKPVKIDQLVSTIQSAINKYGNAEERKQYLRARKTAASTPKQPSPSYEQTLPDDDGKMIQLLQRLLNSYHATQITENREGDWLPLMNVDEYCKRVIQQYQGTMTETELSRRLGFSRDKLWRIRKRLEIPRK